MLRVLCNEQYFFQYSTHCGYVTSLEGDVGLDDQSYHPFEQCAVGLMKWVYRSEINRVQTWLKFHPSDQSAYAYLTHLIERIGPLLTSNNEWVEVIRRQMETVNSRLDLYPTRECTWVFRRNMLLLLRRIDPFSVNLPRPTVEPLWQEALALVEDAESLSFSNSLTVFTHWYTNKRNRIAPDIQEESPLWVDILRAHHLWWLIRIIQKTTAPNLAFEAV